jgi:putative nucleotidyltransferase with HDIG domain
MVSRKKTNPQISRHAILSGVLLASVVILAYALLIQVWAFRPASPSIQLGDVAQQDVRAPQKIEYASEVRAEQARVEAERSIDPVYAPPDPAVARGQLELMQSAFAAIGKIRQEEFPTLEQKEVDLMSIDSLDLSQETADNLLALSIERWDIVKWEASNVLEQLMRNPIRSDDLGITLQGLPSRVSLSLSELEVKLVVDLVTPLVSVNSFYSPVLTEAARKLARESVEPVMNSYRQGEMIVSAGAVITPEIYEALTVQDLIVLVDHKYEYAGGAALVILVIVLCVLFLNRRKPHYTNDLRSLILIAILFLFFLAGARFTIPNRTIVPYLFPIPAFGLLISTLFGIESGIVFSLMLSVLTAYGLPNALDLMPYYFLSSMGAILALGSARRVGHFLWASAVIAGVGFLVVIAFRFPFLDTDLIGLATLAGAAFFNGIASTSLALLLQFLLAQFLGSTTTLQLLEISRPDFPLLQYFLRRAPGTYQHSLQVMNLAEQAAEKIGADALLTRVGALYHDVGKAENASFFIENQLPGNINPHNDIDPVKSAEIIISHVADGLMLAHKHRLPRRLQDFISEHHGTLLTRYQYNRALELAGGEAHGVDIEKFRYPGPTPGSRETALLMFADEVEAIARTKQPRNEDELREIVRKVVEKAQKEGQITGTPLTQKDLHLITESFINTMQGIYHPRLEYPKESRTEPLVTKDLGLPALLVPKRKARKKEEK